MFEIVSIPVGMVAYTGIETISNMAEEARDPGRDVPRSIGLVALAVFAIYAFLPRSPCPRCRCTSPRWPTR